MLADPGKISLVRSVLQMILSQLLPLNAAKRTVGQSLWRRPIVNHMQRKALARTRENTDRTYRFASRPQPKFLYAALHQIGAADRGCWPDKYHRFAVNLTFS
jgi:hypothetical protein